MGLGKTIQAISLILTHPHPRYPPGSSYSALSPNSKAAAKDIPENIGRGTLVIAPLALIKQWEREIAERVESSHKLRVRVHHGPSRAKDPRDLKNFDIVITTYETIRSEHNQSSLTEKANGDIDAVGCFGIYWWRIVCDEAHTIKNRLAKGSIAACALKARYRWCLTGTPLQNNLDELQSLFKFLRIKPFNDLAVWKEQISRPMQQNKGTIAIERLRVVLGLVMLRRTKDVLKKDAEGKSGNQIRLPDRNQEKIVGEFNAIEKAFYEKLEERTEESLEKMMSGFGDFGGKLGGSNMTSALVLLLRLRQACNHPHLLAGKIHKDKDSGMGLVTPRKKKPSKPITAEDPAEEDDLTDLMGGLSVFQKKCDICFRGLSTDEMDRREVRCTDCSEDLKAIDKVSSKVKKVKVKKVKVKKSKAPKAKRGRPTVFDSDDEDSQAEEGTDTEDDDDDSFVVESEAEAESESDSDFDEDAYNQLVPSTKISKLVEIVKKETRQKNKIIVFSQFTSMLDLIEPFLQQQGIVFARYDGSMKNDDREASLRRLRGDGEYAARQWCGVLLCSLKCGALGLNLTCASRVVILEPFWNPVRLGITGLSDAC